MSATIRIVKFEDTQAILDIYAPHVSEGTTSFEMTIPSHAQMWERISTYLNHAPWIVMEIDGDIAGYAYASEHRARAAYDWAIEVSVYVHPDHQRKGVGRKLYACLFELIKAQGYCTVIAGITMPNTPSEHIHQAMGFQLIGTYHKVGYKHGDWRDTRWYELDMNPNNSPPKPIISMAELDQSGHIDRIVASHNV